MGSWAIISIALNGWGWKSMSVCSKRGDEPASGLGLWLVDQVPTWLGACHVDTSFLSWVWLTIPVAASALPLLGSTGVDVDAARVATARRERLN
jgi:hypothetical protein